MTIGKVVTVALLCAGLVACMGISREYTWVQQTDGVGMKAPVVHHMRLAVNVDRSTVTTIDDLIDKDGVSYRSMEFYGGKNEERSSCQIFDTDNFQCSIRDNSGNAVVILTMEDAKLEQTYFGTFRQFKKHWTLAN